jgi:hypothetical protein
MKWVLKDAEEEGGQLADGAASSALLSLPTAKCRKQTPESRLDDVDRNKMFSFMSTDVGQSSVPLNLVTRIWPTTTPCK